MPKFKLKEISKITGGIIVNDSSDITISDYQFDTRMIGDDPTLFFALKSEKGNGHNFVHELNSSSKIAAVVEKSFDTSGIKIPLIVVDDSLKAAHQLASFIRRKFNSIKYIGITGSAGKTTSKEFISQLLSFKYKVFKSFQNWNNWIGMPFSMMRLKGDEDFAVFELAMSYPGIGEIDLLAEILKPDIAIILNVFPVHLEFLKTLENVASGKSEILNYLDSDSTAFITGDSPEILKIAKEKFGRKIFFGNNSNSNDIVLKKIDRYENETELLIDFYGIETRFSTPLVNHIHIENLFAAIIVSQNSGMKNFEIEKAITGIKPLSNRGRIKKIKDFTIIDETYNSNPIALEKTLSWIDREFDKTKIAVIGDMLELGESENDYHLEAGRFFSNLNFSLLVTVGKRAEKIADGAVAGGFPEKSILRFVNSADAGRFIFKQAEKGSVILFKASRGIALEDAIREIENG